MIKKDLLFSNPVLLILHASLEVGNYFLSDKSISPKCTSVLLRHLFNTGLRASTHSTKCLDMAKNKKNERQLKESQMHFKKTNNALW